MTWTSNWPNGNVSVKANETPGLNNTHYIEDTMGDDIIGTNANTTPDHFWNLGGGVSGHHRFVKLPGFVNNVGAAVDPVFDPVFIQNVIYAKLKSATESTAQQDTQPFCINSTNVMQLLGIRAMGVFNASNATPAQADVVYSHNLALQAAGTPGIVRDSTGTYTVTFASALPSANYLVIGGAIRNSPSTGQSMLFSMDSGNTLTNVKSTTRFKFLTALVTSSSLSLHDPLQCWFVVFGG